MVSMGSRLYEVISPSLLAFSIWIPRIEEGWNKAFYKTAGDWDDMVNNLCGTVTRLLFIYLAILGDNRYEPGVWYYIYKLSGVVKERFKCSLTILLCNLRSHVTIWTLDNLPMYVSITVMNIIFLVKQNRVSPHSPRFGNPQKKNSHWHHKVRYKTTETWLKQDSYPCIAWRECAHLPLSHMLNGFISWIISGLDCVVCHDSH